MLLVGQVGAGKSSLLAALAGLIEHEGSIRWNGEEVADPQVFLRPGQVAHVAQVPRVLSGSLRRQRPAGPRAALRRARGRGAARPRRGRGRWPGRTGRAPRRTALRWAGAAPRARPRAGCRRRVCCSPTTSPARSTRAPRSSFWTALRERNATVIGATSKRAALARADRVVVLEDGAVAAAGPWSELVGRVGTPRRLTVLPRPSAG
ncbi:ATP-binding cassette domain-containing protein [Nocardioides convexus]|uniref:ATP-binding cassette domain-containing protein n=1 Tax=Nocardioides convexus TaxID=2712224 RepID=UPI00241852D4|nr:ATP-binding cassette domain-containing protein [Nocardioides convexus]